MRLRFPIVSVFVCLFLCEPVVAFEIFALGTSATNCRGVERDKIFTVRLQEILRADGFDVAVINGGVDGDEPRFMQRRLEAALHPDTRLVIFEPGANDRSSVNVEYSEKILSFLEDRGLPAIYASNAQIQTNEEAAEMAGKHHAYYYGRWNKGVSRDAEHYQFDTWRGSANRGGGHMTAAGCQLVASNIAALVKRVLRERDIH